VRGPLLSASSLTGRSYHRLPSNHGSVCAG
jgi:hypothetical protein